MSRNTEGTGWGLRIGFGVLVLLVVLAVGLSIYGGRVSPVQHSVDQVLPNDHFPS